jgi:hypothetical protein
VLEREREKKGPSVSRDKDVDNLAVLVEERQEIICGGS